MKLSELININNFMASHDKNGKMGKSKVVLVMMLVKFGKKIEEFTETQKAAYEKLKKDYEGFDENVQKMQDYQAAINAKKEELPWTEEEYKAFTEGDYKSVMEQLDEAIKPELAKEVELDYKRFDADGFSEWMESNNIDTKTGAYLSQYLLDDKTL